MKKTWLLTICLIIGGGSAVMTQSPQVGNAAVMKNIWKEINDINSQPLKRIHLCYGTSESAGLKNYHGCLGSLNAFFDKGNRLRKILMSRGCDNIGATDIAYYSSTGSLLYLVTQDPNGKDIDNLQYESVNSYWWGGKLVSVSSYKSTYVKGVKKSTSGYVDNHAFPAVCAQPKRIIGMLKNAGMKASDMFIKYDISIGIVGKKYWIKSAHVSVRETPSLNGKVVGTLSASDSVQVIEKGVSQSIGYFGSHYWYKVVLHEPPYSGWVFGAFIEQGGGFACEL